MQDFQNFTFSSRKHIFAHYFRSFKHNFKFYVCSKLFLSRVHLCLLSMSSMSFRCTLLVFLTIENKLTTDNAPVTKLPVRRLRQPQHVFIVVLVLRCINKGSTLVGVICTLHFLLWNTRS